MKNLVSHRFILFLIVGIQLLLFSGCAVNKMLPPKTDITTLATLEQARTDISLVYDSFTTDTPDTARLEIVLANLEKASQLEDEKGARNQNIVSQIQDLKQIIVRDRDARLNRGKWNETNLINRKQLVNLSFEIAIENVKKSLGG